MRTPTHEEAERIGRETAAQDFRDGTLDANGNIRDSNLLKVQVRHLIVRDLESNDRSLRELELILDATGGPRSTFPLRTVIHAHLSDLHPELDAGRSASTEPRPIDVAQRAYEQAVLARRRRVTTRHKKGPPK